MNSDEWIRSFRQSYVQNAEKSFDFVMARVASPIERVMLACLVTEGFSGLTVDEHMRTAIVAERMGVVKSSARLGSDGCGWVVLVQPTIQFGGFVVTPDFGLIEATVPEGVDPAAVAVELDGHEFHERTKDQAGRDKRRDRALVSKGWTVIRFTGAEVVRSPAQVLGDWQIAFQAECKKRGRDIE